MIFKRDTKTTMMRAETLFTRKLRWSKTALFCEQLWLCLWLPFTVIGLFLVVSLLGVWPAVGPYGQRIGLTLFALLGLTSLLPLLRISWPSRDQALNRLDAHSQQLHRPAYSFDDKLGDNISDPKSLKLWQAYKNRLAKKVKALKIKSPHPRTDAHDPFALRALLLLILAVLFFFHGSNSYQKIARAFTLDPLINISALRIDAWVTPPNYTGKPPMLVANGAKTPKRGEQSQQIGGKSFQVPQNSELVIRINGDKAHLSKLIKIKSAQDGAQKNGPNIPPTDASKETEKSVEFRYKLKNSQRLAIMVNSSTVDQWQFDIIVDTPPKISLIDLPSQARSGAIKLKYKMSDDYGVIQAQASFQTITPANTIKRQPPTNIDPKDLRFPLGSAPSFPLHLPSGNGHKGGGESFKDLTSHPWAGLGVSMQLEASDEGGNKGFSPALQYILPERKFTKPFAIALIAARKKLIAEPFKKRLIARSLLALSQKNLASLKDMTIYLGLRTAHWGLVLRKTRPQLEEVAELLWQLARRIEDGDLSKTEQQLRTAQEELRRALEKGASEKEISQLIDKLRQALKDYMQALAKMQQNQQNQQNQQGRQSSQNLNAEQLEKMLKNIEQLAKSGSKDLAKQMLAELQNMLENIERGRNAQNNSQEQLSKSLNDLSKLMKKQQQLLNETYQQRGQNSQSTRRQPNRGQKGRSQRGGAQAGRNQAAQGQRGQAGQLSQRQQGLRGQLGQFMRDLQSKMGQIPGELNSAGKLMGQAGQSLGEGQLSGALRQQGNALEQLRQGAKALAKQMQQNSSGAGRRTGGNDPLGRPQATRGIDTGESVKVPDEIDIQRAREILRELRTRSSNPKRPQIELDYIERLLKQF